MKVKELIELLKQTDPEKEVVIEYRDIDHFGDCCGTEYVTVDSNICKLKDSLFVINITDYQY